jgi:hypothetical protein
MEPSSPSGSAAVARGTSGGRFLASAVLFVVSYSGARLGLERVEPGSTGALLLAFLPVPFFALVIAYYVRNVRALDELERRIQLEALALAFPVALAIVFTVGLLSLAGFHGEQNWDLPRLWPLVLLPYWFGLWRARRRYA